MKKLLLIALLIVGCDSPTEAEDCAGIAGGDSVIDCNENCGGAYPDEYCGTVTDIDENTYKTIRIDNEIWMAENLKVTHYRNGEEIRTGLNYDEWKITEGAYAVYGNNPYNADIYGNLYNWFAVDDERGLCMEGWHVPTYDEFATLLSYTNGSDGLREVGNRHWEQNQGATNLYGFTVLPGGHRYSEPFTNTSYQYKGERGTFWTSSNTHSNGEINTLNAWWILITNHSGASKSMNDNKYGRSVRCLKD